MHFEIVIQAKRSARVGLGDAAQRGAHSGHLGPEEQWSSPVAHEGQQIEFEEQCFVPQVMLSCWIGPEGRWDETEYDQDAAAAAATKSTVAAMPFNMRTS